jgi:transposase-like protein
MSEPEKLKNRRSFTPEFKVKVVLELVRGDRSLAGSSLHYNIKETVLSRWKHEFLTRAPQVFAEPSNAVSDEIEELKKLVGEQAIELSILKKAYGISTRQRGGSS